MEIDQLNRVELIQEMKEFTEKTDQQLTQILCQLNWTADSIENAEPLAVCPFNSAHRMPLKCLEKHLEKCEWSALGYGPDDIPLSTPSASSTSQYCLKIDENLLEEILGNAQKECPSMIRGSGIRLIPQTSDRLIADFSPDERKALYDYVVANTASLDIGVDIADLNKPQTPGEARAITYLELAAQERNLKRRRAKHRGVHTNKKSQTEILREIINQQMEMLAEHIAETSSDTEKNQSPQDYYPKQLTPRDGEYKKPEKITRDEFRDRESRHSSPSHHRREKTSRNKSRSHSRSERHEKSSREHRHRNSDDRKHRHHSKHDREKRKHRHRSRERR